MKKAKFKMAGNGSGMEEVSESSCFCAPVLKKDAGVVEGGFNTETQRRRGTEFKMTEIGLIPEDWEVKRLGDVLTIGNGKDYKHLRCGTIPVYGTGGLMTYVSEWLYDGATVCIGRKGTIDVPQYHEGKIWTVDTLYYTYGFKEVDIKFLYYLFLRIDWLSYNSATGVPSLTAKAIYDIEVALPPLPEQKKIAEALSDVDELLAAMTTLIEKKRAIKQGAMQELLGIRDEELGIRNCVPRRRLPGFSGEWVEKRLGEIGEFIAGNGFPLNKQGGQSGKYPFFKVSDFNNVGNESALSIANNYISVSTFNKLHCSLIPSGSIVFAKIGAAIALERKRRVCQDSCIDNNMMAFCVNKQNDERFVTECLRRIVFADLVESTALPALNVRKLRGYKIIVPENISEQKAIAEVLSDMDAEIEALEAKRAKYESIKQGVMQELLTGKTRLKGA